MKNILTYRGITPSIKSSAFIAPTAVISGDTVIGENVGIWYGCVIRGDVAGDRQTQSRSTRLTGSSPVDSIETLENSFNFGLGNTNSLICHGNSDDFIFNFNRCNWVTADV